MDLRLWFDQVISYDQSMTSNKPIIIHLLFRKYFVKYGFIIITHYPAHEINPVLSYLCSHWIFKWLALITAKLLLGHYGINKVFKWLPDSWEEGPGQIYWLTLLHSKSTNGLLLIKGIKDSDG